MTCRVENVGNAFMIRLEGKGFFRNFNSFKTCN